MLQSLASPSEVKLGAGIGCGVGLGFGIGQGIVLKTSVTEELAALAGEWGSTESPAGHHQLVTAVNTHG